MTDIPNGGLAAPSKGHTLYLVVICVVAALGGLLFGFDTAVISGAIGFVRAEFSLSAALMGWTASAALIGCMLGALGAGVVSDRFGRRRVLLLAALLFTMSAAGCGLSRTVTELVLARIVGGLGIGIASMLSPMYIAEVSPAGIRGRLVSLQQFAIITGILAAYFSNSLVLRTSLTEAGKWRWMFAVGAFPAVLFFVLLLGVPESPRWLMKQGREDKARAVLARVGGADPAGAEVEEIRRTLRGEGGSLRDVLRPGMRLALLVGVVLAVLQQVTGINAILYYAPEIFKRAGSGLASAFNDTVWIGIVNMLFTIVAIGLIDRLGRKRLLIGGACGMAAALALVGLAFRRGVSGPGLLAVILAYVACFSASLGPVVWVVLSEIFPTKVRGRAMSVATVALWAACFLVSQTFPVLLEGAGSAATFWIYGALCVVTVLFVAAFVPETKGRSLEEIERLWDKAPRAETAAPR